MTLISRDNLDLRDFVVSVPFVSRFLVHSEKDELPLPLKSSEVKNILQDENEDVVENGMVNIDFDIGQKVLIVSGPFNNFSGNIKEIYPDKGKVSVNIEIFGRETPVEIDHYKVKKQ